MLSGFGEAEIGLFGCISFSARENYSRRGGLGCADARACEIQLLM